MHGSVTLHMTAPPEKIWGLVSDITNTGKFSPETFEAQWSAGSTGPEVGARFRGHVKRNGKGPIYWTNCMVTACDPGREFTFQVMGPGDKPLNTWRYLFEPSGEGTDVTESFQLTDTAMFRLYWAVLGKLRGKTNENGMRTTLERIKAVAESEPEAGSET